jgi:hypothetical protein
VSRILVLFLGAGLTVALAILALRVAPGRNDRAALEHQVTALGEELERLKENMRQMDRSLGRVGLQIGAQVPARATSTSDAVGAEPAGPAPPPLSPAEEAARIAHNNAELARKRSAYYDRLDRQVRDGRPSAANRELLRRNVEALRALPNPAATAFAFDRIECTDTLCRIEARRTGTRNSRQLHVTSRHLMGGMSALTMRPFEGDQTVFYAAPVDHELPTMDL